MYQKSRTVQIIQIAKCIRGFPVVIQLLICINGNVNKDK